MSSKKGMLRSIKGRFLLVVVLASAPFFLAVSSSAVIVYRVSNSRLQREVENATIVLHNLIDSMLKNSVRSYLRSKVEAGIDLAERVQPGEGVEELVSTLSSMQVGSSGYYYAIRPDGVVVFHPDASIIGTDFSWREPVNEQIRVKEGYLEYMWQNSDEEEPRKKALYMAYLPELDWILSATSYRDEFTGIIELEALRETVSTVNIGPGGYSYVISRDGTFIAHPYLSGSEAEGLIPDEEFRSIVGRFFAEGEGAGSYLWRDSTGEKMREKFVYFKYLPDFDWVIGTAFYRNEIGKPMQLIVLLNVGIAFVIAIILSLVIFRMNMEIEHYILHIASVLRQSTGGGPAARASRDGPMEISELAVNLNLFLDELQEKTGILTRSLEEKEVLLREIQHRVKNNLQTILSLINLQKGGARSEEARAVLNKTRNQISSMAMVYDHLSQNRERMVEDTVPMREFLDAYIHSILIDPAFSGARVDNELAEVNLPRNGAIYSALLVNELITAAISPRGPSSGDVVRIAVILRREEGGGLMLAVGVNRPVFSGGETFQDGELVMVLAAQLKGLVEFRSDGDNSEFRLRWTAGGDA